MDDRLVVLRLTGEWDIYRAAELNELVAAAKDAGRLLVDLTPCSFLDCTVLGALARLRSYRHACGLPAGRVAIKSPFLRKVFHLAGLAALWPTFETVDEAVRSFEVQIPA
jgi:anti-anti-sigma factor